MKEQPDYLKINKESWNKRTDIHFDSEFYDNESFVEGRSSLNSIEIELLGELKGKKVLHLQCHFGQDSISLARMGANVTGVDLSDRAIEKARELADKCAVQNCKFVCSDVYDLPNHLDDSFDLVFTSYGTIGWLPDLNKWAAIVSRYLKPGGQFVFVEFHPVVWMFDDHFKGIQYRYFNSGPIEEVTDGTYTDPDAPITQDYVSWNHAISEVFGSLIQNGMNVLNLQEFDYSPYDCFNETIEYEKGRYRIKHLEDKIPMVYALLAQKKN